MADILHNVYIHESPEKVFRAISSGEEIQKWWTKRSTGNPIKGDVFDLYFSDDYDWRAELIDIGENVKCEWKVIKADQDWTNTVFGFMLYERDDITVTEFYHKNWREINEHFKRSSYCWAMYLGLLKDYVEKGNITNFEQRTFG